MKKGFYLITAILVLLAGLDATAQRRHIRKAEKAFEDKEYQEVIERLDKAKDKGAALSDALLEKKGISYFKLNEKEEAYNVFSDIEQDKLSGKALVMYGKVQQENMNYNDALAIFEKAINKGVNTNEVQKLKESAEWASGNNYILEGFKVKKSKLDINGASAGVQFYRDGLIYSLSKERELARRFEKNLDYKDMMYIRYNPANGTFGKKTVFSNELKFPFSAGATDFFSDYKHMYFTKVVKGAGGKKISKIFRADYGKNEWYQDVKEMKFNSDDYSCAMPAFNEKEQYMVFASNMPGGQGGFDLYIVYKEGKNKWTKPRNLGTSINTKGQETFPFINQKGTLYFSSDGHNGFGGLDIYKTTKKENGFAAPENMMLPMNSGRDDFALVTNPENPQEGFLASNRHKEGKYDYIYLVNLPKQQQTSSSDEEFMTAADESGSDDLDEFLESGSGESTSESTSQDTSKGTSESTDDELDDFLESATTDETSEEDESSTPDTGNAATLEEAMQEAASGGKRLIYRVQFFSSIKPLDRLKTFEPTGDYVYRYYYKGLYRYTIGEFYTPEPAIKLKNKVQNLGYEDAFVAVFKDQKRVLDVQVYDHSDNKKNKDKQKEQ